MNDFQLTPLYDRVVVRRVEQDTTSEGGIIIPDSANQEKPSIGVVVAVGTGKRNDDGSVQEMQLNVNDRIVFSKYSGTEVKIKGEEYLVMREDDVIGVFNHQTETA